MKHRVGLRVKAIRARRSFSQEELAERISRSIDAVSAIERGKSLPNFETLERLAAGLNVPIKDFFDFGEEDSPRRASHLARMHDAARTLSDEDLEMAADIVEQIAAKSKA